MAIQLSRILTRFKVYGVYPEKRLIQDLRDTVKDLNQTITEIESKLNALQEQIDNLP